MKTYAIGDIHGCHTALQTLITHLDLQPDDTIITLGDYIDRGPDSAGVIRLLMDLEKKHKLVHLLGNHEYQLLQALNGDKEMLKLFPDPRCGGKATLNSYGGTLESIDPTHIAWMQDSALYYETDTHIFVHAGVDPELPLYQQDPKDLIYKRFYNVEPHHSGKTVVCGHTMQADFPTNLGHSICIDTASCADGWLTALDTDTGKCIQTKQDGTLRCFPLPIAK